MASEIPISKLPASTSAQITDILPIVQSGTTYKESLSQIQTLFNITSSSTLPLAELQLNGSSSGTISILPQAAAGTFNFNLPITAGVVGYFLTSGGGDSSPMTWTSISGSGGITTIDGDSGSITPSSGVVTISGGTIGLTTSGSGSTLDLIGTLNVANGGTSATTLTGLLTGNGTSAFTGTVITQYNVLTGGASNLPNSVAPSSTSGIPLISQGSSSQPIFGTTVVAGGGTGDTSFTAYAPICGGTTTTGILQSASTGISTSGFIFVSNGSSALPSFQALSGLGVTEITGTANEVLVNGTSGSPKMGAITLTTPQAIGTTSSVTFGGLTVNLGTFSSIDTNISSGGFGYQLICTDVDSSSGGPSFSMFQNSGTATTSGARLGAIIFGGNAVVGPDLQQGAYIAGFSSQLWTSAHTGAYLDIYVTPNSTNGPVQKFRFDQNGALLIGTTTNDGTNLLQVNGGAKATQFLLTGSSSGTISIVPQAVAGTYNFNLPITAGTSGYLLTSAGGGSSPMTWTQISSAAVTTVVGTANQLTPASATSGAVTIAFTNGLSIGSYQATPPPTGGLIMPGQLGVGINNLASSSLFTTNPTVCFYANDTGNPTLTLLTDIITTNPYSLTLQTANSNAAQTGFGSMIRLLRSRGTNASPAANQSGDVLGGIYVAGYNGSALTSNLGAFRANAAENWTTGANGTYWDLAATQTGATSRTVIMTFRAGSSGVPLIGIGNITALNALDVSGGVALGSYAGSNTAPTGGLIFSGKLGVNDNNPSAQASIVGSCVVGYSSGTAVGANSFAVAGSLFIGASIPGSLNNGALSSAPNSSNTTTSGVGGFGSTMSFNTATQNTTGGDILLFGFVTVSAATTATLTIGTNSSSTVATNAFSPSFSLAGTYYFAAYVPVNYYVKISNTGTITVGGITCVAFPI